MSPGHDRIFTLMNFQQLNLAAPDLHKIKVVGILAWIGKGFMSPHSFMSSYGQLIAS